ncbi:MAG: rod shape-determining protein RodA [Clostridia bacterium]|nr:rod shape-determining protein RodA [Clostridia bacterium]
MWDKRLLKNLDGVFFAFILILLGVSLIVLTSASSNVVTSNPYFYLQRQIMWICVGFVAMAFMAWFDYHNLERFSKTLYIFMILILIGVLFMPEQKGAHRWYDLGFMDFQPSELAKILTVICFAEFLAKRQGPKMQAWSTFFICFLVVGFPMFLVLIEPDLGTALAFSAILLAMMWVGGIPSKRMIALLIILAILIILIFGVLWIATDGYKHTPEELPIPLPLEPYQLTRLIIFINPDMDPLNTGYHIIQSHIAIGSGGLLGKGFGNGSQVQGNFLPEHHTDFIFSVVGEEFGFVGCIVLLAIYLVVLSRAVRIALNAVDMFGTLIVTGITAIFAFQIFVNIGMTIGVMPVTGLPLPMMSYGGTSMLMNMISIGLILSVNLRHKQIIF